MVEVKNEEQEEALREVGHLLLEVKCLARLGALASILALLMMNYKCKTT